MKIVGLSPLGLLRLLLRKARARPLVTLAISFAVLLGWSYLWIFVFEREYWIRWYWNYLVSFHPAIAYVLPPGTWENPPDEVSFFEPIYKARYMGKWPFPQLSPPTYAWINGSHVLTSAAIVKIHIFSTPNEEAAEKRNLIRQLSPLLNLPEAYRHLVEIRFVLGHHLKDGRPDPEVEKGIEMERRTYGDILQLEGLKDGDNLRQGKFLRWLQATVREGERPAWYTFKMDDDTVLNLPHFLDELLSLNPQTPTYLGHSLNRWPAYHFHFTGMLTGYSYGVVNTLVEGINNMRKEDIEYWWDDDVLAGEMMFSLPSGSKCSVPNPPAFCDPHKPPPWGYLPPPPNPDPRTSLLYHDFLRKTGDPKLWWVSGWIATHPSKLLERYLKEWGRIVEGTMWEPPMKIQSLADPAFHEGEEAEVFW